MVLLEQQELPEAPFDDAVALFEEARRRTRRRRASRLALVTVLVAAAIVIYELGPGAQPRSSASASPTPAVDRAGFVGHGDLAFISRGRLWVLDGATGRLAAVTKPSEHASGPAFSPNGRWLAYAVTTPGASEVWLARSDGSAPRLVARGVDASGWLPDDRLLSSGRLWRVAPTGALTPAGSAPSGLHLAAAAGERRYIFISSTLRVGSESSTGVDRVEVSGGLTATRTTWLQTPVAYAPRSGLDGPSFYYAIALPSSEGILIGSSPSCCDNADGVNLYEISAPGARPKNLGVSVGNTVSVGADGIFAFTRGGDRYAWVTKAVETCSTTSEHCTAVPTAPGRLSMDPAFSPNGEELAFVQASDSNQGLISQQEVSRWYRTRSLWIQRGQNATPARIAGTAGAASPVWSADGDSLLYTADDALWLLPALSAKPVRIAAPLFAPADWSSFYGEVGWSGQFAWSAATRG